MKRKNLVNIGKRIMAGCLAVAMVLTGIIIVPKTAKANEATATEVIYDDATKEYKIKTYWTDKKETRKAPVKPGFVFGGWYVKEGEKDIPLKEADLVDGGIDKYVDTAYAKFVPAEVLSIKTQKGIGNEGTVSLRILSTVDSTNYQEVGFQYKLATSTTAMTENIKKVYSAIRPYKGASVEQMQTPGQEFVNGASEYFIAADVSSIKPESVSKIVYARPFWVTMDGTKVLGLGRNSRVEDKDNNYTSVGINLLSQLEGTELAAVAAGKIQVTYNYEAFDVVDETPDITEHGENGGTYLFPKMQCHVDKETGTITFVGNAVAQNEEFIDLLADGLFANVRFVRKKGASEQATLNFEINKDVTDFCNWEEDDVKAVVVQ